MTTARKSEAGKSMAYMRGGGYEEALIPKQDAQGEDDADIPSIKNSEGSSICSFTARLGSAGSNVDSNSASHPRRGDTSNESMGDGISHSRPRTPNSSRSRTAHNMSWSQWRTGFSDTEERSTPSPLEWPKGEQQVGIPVPSSPAYDGNNLMSGPAPAFSTPSPRHRGDGCDNEFSNNSSSSSSIIVTGEGFDHRFEPNGDYNGTIRLASPLTTPTGTRGPSVEPPQNTPSSAVYDRKPGGLNDRLADLFGQGRNPSEVSSDDRSVRRRLSSSG